MIIVIPFFVVLVLSILLELKPCFGNYLVVLLVTNTICIFLAMCTSSTLRSMHYALHATLQQQQKFYLIW